MSRTLLPVALLVLLTNYSDSGNASAEAVPHNFVTARLAPLSFAYDTVTANERMHYLMNHEFVHVVTSDRASTLRLIVFPVLTLLVFQQSEATSMWGC